MDAREWDERYGEGDLVWGAEPNRFVREQCEGLPTGQAIDLACGEGRNALWLARLGWRVVGVDYSAVAIQRARQLTEAEPPEVARRVTWRVEDVTRAGIEADSVDLALISYVHLPPDQTDALMVAAARAVLPEGHLVIVGHDLRNLAEGVSGPQDAGRLYQPGHVRGLLETVPGMVVELASTVERPTDAGTALDALVRARRE